VENDPIEYPTTFRSVLASLTCRLGAWLIRRGYRVDPDGGAVVVVVVHGGDQWSLAWHHGWPAQAAQAAVLAQGQADTLSSRADSLRSGIAARHKTVRQTSAKFG
jgi:hypothetical protein